VRWCEEMGKFGGVFIGRDCNISYIYHKYSQKCVKHNKKVQNQLKSLDQSSKNVCS